jgi:transcriptional regulator with XRE-family HTH domain
LKFGEYLKLCRQNYDLTQEELVQGLYNFDEELVGVDTRTISRWELSQTKPSIERQMKIVRYFQTLSGHVLSCFEKLEKSTIENEICKRGIKNLIGTSKEHILNFPSKSFKVDDIEIKHLRNAENIDDILQMPYTVVENLTDNVYNLSFENIKEWALHPSNLFILSMHKEKFVGLFFSLKLRPAVFEKIINFELHLSELTIEDFAASDELGSFFALAFFAYNDKLSTLLSLRFYAHLIANQDYIEKVGSTPMLYGAKKIAQNMNMKQYKEKKIAQGVLTSYQASLEDLLINEAVMKMLFQKQECPESDI